MTDSDRKMNVKKAAGGDAEAFGLLYEELSPDLYRFALWYLKSPEDAEDAVQEACVSAFRSLGNLKKQESFRAWFMKIILNRCKDIVRRRQRLVTVPEDDPAIQDLPYYENFPEGDMGGLLMKLGDTDREIVLLSVLGGYKSGEIGALLGMKNATVRSRLSRTLHFLRQELEEER